MRKRSSGRRKAGGEGGEEGARKLTFSVGFDLRGTSKRGRTDFTAQTGRGKGARAPLLGWHF